MGQSEVIYPKPLSHKPKEKASVWFPHLKRRAIIPASNVQLEVYSGRRFTMALRGNTTPSLPAGSIAYNHHQCNRSGTSVALNLGYMNTY